MPVKSDVNSTITSDLHAQQIALRNGLADADAHAAP